MTEAFLKAYKNTAKWEGGYVNDPHDRGGETYNGISRKNFPKWEGWEIVDKIQTNNSEKEWKRELVKLDKLVQEIYFESFWKPIRGDDIAIIDEKIAMYVYDMAVNHGVKRGVKLFQKALNDCLAVKEEVKPDGVLGDRTVKALIMANPEQLLQTMKDTRHSFFLSIIKSHKEQEHFKKGWLRRTHGVVK
jgi:lysozyme family protein